MSRESEIYNILLTIKEEIGSLKSSNQAQTVKLERIEMQTTKTNGRVTKLEDVTVTLTTMVSKQNGIYEQNLLGLKDLIKTRGVEIDEIKKKVYGEDAEMEKISMTGKVEVKKIIWGGMIGIAGTLVTFLITKII